MIETEIAIISDVHGNSWALKEVLKDIKNRRIDAILNLGDSLYGPLDPKGTFELICNKNILSISGNQDRFILENVGKKTHIKTLEYVKDSLNENAVDWIKKLPFNLSYSNIYCCHGNPISDSIALLEKINIDHISINSNLDIETTLSNVKENIVVCGHSHIPRIVRTMNKTIINPGSIGLPAYDDDLPIPHKMESLNSYAKYAIVKLKIQRLAFTYLFNLDNSLA